MTLFLKEMLFLLFILCMPEYHAYKYYLLANKYNPHMTGVYGLIHDKRKEQRVIERYKLGHSIIIKALYKYPLFDYYLVFYQNQSMFQWELIDDEPKGKGSIDEVTNLSKGWSTIKTLRGFHSGDTDIMPFDDDDMGKRFSPLIGPARNKMKTELCSCRGSDSTEPSSTPPSMCWSSSRSSVNDVSEPSKYENIKQWLLEQRPIAAKRALIEENSEPVIAPPVNRDPKLFEEAYANIGSLRDSKAQPAKPALGEQPVETKQNNSEHAAQTSQNGGRDSSSLTFIIILCGLGVICVVLIIIIIYYCIKTKFEKRRVQIEQEVIAGNKLMDIEPGVKNEQKNEAEDINVEVEAEEEEKCDQIIHLKPMSEWKSVVMTEEGLRPEKSLDSLDMALFTLDSGEV